MIQPNYYITCYKSKATDTVGYLFLQSKGRKNRKKKALGIVVKYSHFEDFWNDEKQRFKSGLENYKIINEKIENAIEDFTKNDGTKIIPTNRAAGQSFLSFWTDVIDTEIPKQGSKVKHQTVKKKLEKYIQTINKKDITFNDLTPDFINKLHYYFKTSPELTTNSVNSYMKLINNIVRRKMKKEPYTFTVNPFVSITYEKKKHSKRKVLDERELNYLFTTKITDPELDLVRDMYLFQIFASGMRISDLALLRWGNIIYDINNPHSDKEEPLDPKLEYVMYKTREPIETPITFYVCKALLKVTGLNEIYEAHTNLNLIVDKKDEKSINESIRRKREMVNHLISETAIELKKLGKAPNDFVFPILKNEDFRDVNNNDETFKDIISKSEDLHHKLLYGEKIYRRKLDKVGELCGVENIMPHAARHTFTKLMIDAGASTHNIKDELGHTTLNVTDSYMRHKKFKSKSGETFLSKIGNKVDYLDNE